VWIRPDWGLLAGRHRLAAFDGCRTHAKIQTVGAHLQRDSPSVARSLSTSEAADLAAIAKALPLEWCVLIEPPFGQLAIMPIREAGHYHRCHVASASWGAIRRASGLRSH
jgi:hypothetical protein